MYCLFYLFFHLKQIDTEGIEENGARCGAVTVGSRNCCGGPAVDDGLSNETNTKAFRGDESIKPVEFDKRKEGFVVVFGESNASRTETVDGGIEKCKIEKQASKSTRSHTNFGAKEVQEVGDSHGGVPSGHTLGGLGIGEKDCFFGKDAKVS
jgi:hypothetical protein